MTQEQNKAKVQSKDIPQSLSKKKIKKTDQITTGEVVRPEKFAASLRQFSLQYLPDITAEQLKMDPRKKGQRGALDSHIAAQEKLQQFIVLDILRQENTTDMQKTFNFYLKVLKESIKNKDFQSAATVLGALKSPPVLRLRKKELRLRKIGQPPEVIEAGANKCIKLNKEQIKFLSNAEILFDGSNIFENYRKIASALREKNKPFVPMTSTLQQVYAQALGGSASFKEADIDIEFSQDKASATTQIAQAKHNTLLTALLNDFQSNNEFVTFADSRSIDILPRGKDASAFEHTRPIHKTVEQSEIALQINHLLQIQKLKKTQIKNSSDQSSKKTTHIETNSATPISEIPLLVKPIGIAARIGKFSNYAGLDGNPIRYNARQAYLAKQMLQQLSPASDWKSSAVTKLTTSLADQPNKVIQIKATDDDSKAAFGGGEVSVSVSTLQELSDSAEIITASSLLPAPLFLKVQQELRDNIDPQEKRSLKELLIDKYETWKQDYQRLGFKTVAEFERSANIPLNMLAMNVCHSQKTHFFVEQELSSNGNAVNKLRSINLDTATPTVLLSTPGLNLAYGGSQALSSLTNGTAELLITNMWESVLASAINQNCNNLAFSAIGLGAFLPSTMTQIQKSEVASLYYKTLLEKLSQPEFKGKFDSIHINPVFDFAKAALAEQKQHHPEAASIVHQFDGDVKFLAIEFSKENIRCGLLNPSDPDVMWGKYDVGEYYKNGDYVGEEDLVATSTASLGSIGISDVYTNPNKIKSSTPISLSEPQAKEQEVEKWFNAGDIKKIYSYVKEYGITIEDNPDGSERLRKIIMHVLAQQALTINANEINIKAHELDGWDVQMPNALLEAFSFAINTQKAETPTLGSKKSIKIEFADLPITTSSITLFEQLKNIQNSGKHPIHFELEKNKDIAKNSIRIHLDPHKEAIATISTLKENAASNPKIIIKTQKNNLSYNALEAINGIANYLENEFKKPPIFTSKDPELAKLYTLLNNSKAYTVELASSALQDSSIAANDPIDPDEKKEMQKLADVLTVQYTEPKDKSKKTTSPHVAILNPDSRSSLPTTPRSNQMDEEPPPTVSSEKATHKSDETLSKIKRDASLPIDAKKPIWKEAPSSISSNKPSDKKSDTPSVTHNPGAVTNNSTKAKATSPLRNIAIGQQRIKAQTQVPTSSKPQEKTTLDLPTVISQSDPTLSVESKGKPKNAPPSSREKPLLQKKVGFHPILSDEFGQTQNLSLQQLHDFAKKNQQGFDIKEIKKLPDQQQEGFQGLEFIFKRDDATSKPVSAYATESENQNIKFSVSKSLYTNDKSAVEEIIWKMCRLAVNAAEPNSIFTIPEKMSPPEKREMVKTCFERAIQEALQIPGTKFTTETIPKVVDKAEEGLRNDTRPKGG